MRRGWRLTLRAPRFQPAKGTRKVSWSEEKPGDTEERPFEPATQAGRRKPRVEPPAKPWETVGKNVPAPERATDHWISRPFQGSCDGSSEVPGFRFTLGSILMPTSSAQSGRSAQEPRDE